jgi:hypothetical protein
VLNDDDGYKKTRKKYDDVTVAKEKLEDARERILRRAFPDIYV